MASDDGYLYALRLSDGHLLWKVRGGRTPASILGNQRMISKWPARGGPVVADDVVYFAAGIWPTEGIYVHALEARSGEPIWCNKDAGAIYMPQPHGGANATSGISAQGYLVVSGNHLFVPTGRAVPASLDRKTGKLEYFRLQKYGHNGGSQTMAVGDIFFNSGLSFSADQGNAIAKIGTGQLARSETGIIRAAGTTVTEYIWREKKDFDRKGKRIVVKTLQPAWTIEDVPKATAILVAGHHVVLGSKDSVSVVDTGTRQVIWKAAIDGVAYGLSTTADQLLVSTDKGQIYCFGSALHPTAQQSPTVKSRRPRPFTEDYAGAAKEIIQRSEKRDGYCVDLGCGDGQLTVQLALQTDLHIIAVDPDEQNVVATRQRLIDAGLYGSRVTVQQRDTAETGFPRYFANLVVCGRSVLDGPEAIDQQEAKRLQRPFGGVVCAGKPGQMQIATRDALPGAGSWTHQYADPANTLNSQDSLVRGHLGMLWFRDVNFQLSQRHGRPPAPLFHRGILYHEGINGLIAVDAYNGCELWRFEIPGVLKAYDGDELMGVAGTGSNYCIGGNSLYVRTGTRCYRLDAVTGKEIAQYETPKNQTGKQSPWGYIAWDSGILFGSQANDQHIVTYRYLNRGGDMTKLFTESTGLFAIDTDTGSCLWNYKAKNSIRHNTIAIADGTVFLIDRPLALFDRVKRPKTKEQRTGTLLALNARTGKQLWKNSQSIFGTLLAVSSSHKQILMSYQPTRFRLDSELGGRMAAFRSKDGVLAWDIKANYASRPMINDRTIYTQGGAWDLLTGKPVPFEFKRSYGCGTLASSRHMLLFRSATLGYYDLSGKRKTENYGGMRPGCWINTLPVGGIVVVPDATAGCECSYLNRAWVALEPIARATN